MEEKLDIMLDMYSDKSLEEWMASLSTSALSKEATKKAYVEITQNCIFPFPTHFEGEM